MLRNKARTGERMTRRGMLAPATERTQTPDGEIMGRLSGYMGEIGALFGALRGALETGPGVNFASMNS